ncbi:MAG TPA: hypothetical protein VFS44_13645 [Gemmatimonadaceae bacterium]|nr:hypothetical protein [Gemmatimonadaceae bacterium]
MRTEAEWNAGAFERTAGSALSAAVVTGIAVALASAIPETLRAPVLALSLIVWAVMVLRAIVAAARTAHAKFAGGERVPVAIACAGIAAALLVGAQLELIRAVLGRHDLVWLLDWRWTLAQAQAIARFGGAEHALDYAGAPIGAPVGPAWLAGAAQRLFGIGMGFVLFGLVPALCTLTIVIAGMRLLRRWGVLHRHAAIAVALTLTLPLAASTLRGAARGIARIDSPLSWHYLPTSIALASLFALAVGLAALAIVHAGSARWSSLALGAAGVASVGALRPEYLVGIAVVAVLCGARGEGRGIRDSGSGKRKAAAGVGIIAGVLLVAVWAPGMTMLGGMHWMVGAERGRWIEPLSVGTAVAVVAAMVWAIAYLEEPAAWRTIGRALAACALAVLVVSLASHWVGIGARSDVLANARAIGTSDDLARELRRAMERAVEPPRLLLLMTSFAIIVAAAARASRAVRAAAATLGALVVLSPLALLARASRHAPAVDAAEDGALHDVLRHVPQGDGVLLVSSDLADPADDWARPLGNALLVMYGGQAFYVADVRTVHYARPDAPARMRELRTFFGTPWSAWHDAWAVRAGVTHVLVHDRCPPVWLSDRGVPLLELAHSGAWTVYALDHRQAPSAPPWPDVVRDVRAVYGNGGCL